MRLLADDAHDRSAWQAYVAEAPQATIYHDLAWRDIFGTSLGYRCFALMAVDAAGGAVRGVLPLYRVPSLLGRPRLVAVPFRDRGGIVCDDPAAFLALAAEAAALCRRLGAASLVLKSTTPYPEALAAAAGLARSDYWVHSIAPLGGLDEARLAKALGDKTRNMIRQAERGGLRVVEGDAGPASVARWYALHQQSQKSLGLPPFPKAFFASMIEALVPRGLARLFLVEQGDDRRAVAGSIVLIDRQTAIYGYSASVPVDRRLRPNDLMLFRIMCRMLEAGMESLDLGSDSPAQEGLLFFKRKWLARQSPIPRYTLGAADADVLDSSASRFGLVRALARHVPVPLARVTLGSAVRFFG